MPQQNQKTVNRLLKIAARSSSLSQAQVAEVLAILRSVEPELAFDPIWVQTRGDLDKTTSLRELGNTDFFTREVDALLQNGAVRLAIHSAKDLPQPLASGLHVALLTQGLDARDALVLREGETLGSLPSGAWIATSSKRREEAVCSLCPDVRFRDVRGTIEERLAVLWREEVDGVVIAEAALIRLKLTFLPRVYLPGPTAEGQGRLAVLCRQGDAEMTALCQRVLWQHCT